MSAVQGPHGGFDLAARAAPDFDAALLALPAAERKPAASRPAGFTPPALRMLAWCVGCALIAGALLPLAPRVASGPAPLRLVVEGELAHTAPAALRAAVAPLLQQGLYGLDLAAMRRRAETLPWVAIARVERAWPDTVRLRVTEHVPYARWNEGALLAEDGAVFTPAAAEAAEAAALPQLAGPDGQQAFVRATYEALRTQLAGTGFEPAGLIQNARGEWTAVTSDGIELRLGRGAPETRVATLAGPVRTALAGRLQEVAYVDLHYVNGFAVGWRAAAGGADGSAGPPRGND